jgi:putative DNA primase/helicase
MSQDETIEEMFRNAEPVRPSRDEAGNGAPGDTPITWPEPQPLPDGLPPVAAFEYELLPPILHRGVEDIAERMQCPPDFPAVALMVTLSSIIGRRVGIAPKKSDDWSVIPNLWGALIGRPGIMKSPPLKEATRPLEVLQARAIEHFKQLDTEHKAATMVADESERVAKEAIRKMLKEGKSAAASERAEAAVGAEHVAPTCRRYIVNDSTVEKLGEILNENPHGVLLLRDELIGFFRTLERQGHESDRAFYLESWNGDGSFTYDRIGRGTLHITGACLSILGSIQPGPLSDLVRGLRGSGDDGLLQRFQLATWPDASREWHNVDRAPDREAREAVQGIIEQLDAMTGESTGADPGAVPLFRFSDEAQALFDIWRESLELRLRGDTEHPMLESHLAKYRSLVPSLALILHLTETREAPVEILALERAIAWAEYLETHARRIYAPAISPDMDAARALAKRIEANDVGAAFALRDIYRQGWSGLSTRDEVAAAVGVLADYDWLRSFEETTPGRTRTLYRVNPAVLTTERSA